MWGQQIGKFLSFANILEAKLEMAPIFANFRAANGFCFCKKLSPLPILPPMFCKTQSFANLMTSQTNLRHVRLIVFLQSKIQPIRMSTSIQRNLTKSFCMYLLTWNPITSIAILDTLYAPHSSMTMRHFFPSCVTALQTNSLF